MNERLQFKHDYTIYGSLEEIKRNLDYSIGQAKQSGGTMNALIPMLGEPVVFRYESDGALHLVLGVGKVETIGAKNDEARIAADYPSYVLLDLDALNESMDATSETEKAIENIVNGLGFEPDGSFDADKDPTHIMHKEYFEGEDAVIVNYIAILHDKLKETSDALSEEALARQRGDEAAKEYAAGLYQGKDAIKVTDSGDKKVVSLELKEEENVLSQNGNGLRTVLKLRYNETDNTVELLGVNDALVSSFDASVFIKDGMLQDVIFIDTVEKAEEYDPELLNPEDSLPYILMLWNSDGGAKKVRIMLKSFIDVYAGGDGINVEDYTISVDIDDNSEGFLTLSPTGLKLSGVQAAIDSAAAGAKTAVKIDEVHKKHILMSGETKSDGHVEYTFWEDDIASDTEMRGLISSTASGLSAATSEAISTLETAMGNAITEMGNSLGNAINATNSAVSRNEQAIAQNASDISGLKNFAELQVGTISGEVISTVVESNRGRINDLEGRMDAAEGGIANKVDKVEGKGLSTNDYTNEDKALLQTVAANAQENVIEAVKVNGTPLEVNSDKAVNVEVPFTSLGANEKMLTLNNGVLESMFSVNYDSDAKKIFFYGKTDNLIGEVNAADFVVDGMLKNASVLTENGVKYLYFIFNTDAGGREIKIPVTDLVTEYAVSGGSENYLVIDNFKIGLKVDAPDNSGLASGSALHGIDSKYSAITHNMDDKVGEGFVDASGATISITHKINELESGINNFINEYKLEFDEDFKVAGINGVLGTGEYKNGDTITAGTKLMDVVKNVMQKKLLPEGVAPTAKIVLTGDSPIEVGVPAAISYRINFNPGYYKYDDGTSGATSINVTSATVTLLNNGRSVAASNAYPDGAFTGITATDGMNLSLIANISYASTYIPKDNMGVDVPDRKIPDAQIEFAESENVVTAYRPMFYGSIKDGDIADYSNITSDEVLRLLTKASAETVSNISIASDAEAVVIMIPNTSTKEIRKIIDTDSGFDLMDVFERYQATIKTYAGESGNGVTYYAYVYDPRTQIGANTYKIFYTTGEEKPVEPSQDIDISMKADKVIGGKEGNLAALDDEGNLMDSGWSMKVLDVNITENEGWGEGAGKTFLLPKTNSEQEAIIKECCKNGTISQITLRGVVTEADHNNGNLLDYPVGYTITYPIISAIYNETERGVIDKCFKYTINAPIKELNNPGGAGFVTTLPYTFVEW